MKNEKTYAQQRASEIVRYYTNRATFVGLQEFDKNEWLRITIEFLPSDVYEIDINNRGDEIDVIHTFYLEGERRSREEHFTICGVYAIERLKPRLRQSEQAVKNYREIKNK